MQKYQTISKDQRDKILKNLTDNGQIEMTSISNKHGPLTIQYKYIGDTIDKNGF